VSQSLFGPYVLGVELASMLLLAALIGARHIGERREEARLGQAPALAAAGGNDPQDEGAGADGGGPEPDGGGPEPGGETPSPDDREALIAEGGA
jgi:hypothetical protein